MEIRKFVRRSFTVRGEQVTAENINELAEWCGGTVLGIGTGNEHIKVDVKRPLNEKQTQAHVGDWVLSTKKGFKVYNDRAFHANFKTVDEDTKPVITNVVQYDLTALPDDIYLKTRRDILRQSDYVIRG